jgi:hypothetical protein
MYLYIAENKMAASKSDFIQIGVGDWIRTDQIIRIELFNADGDGFGMTYQLTLDGNKNERCHVRQYKSVKGQNGGNVFVKNPYFAVIDSMVDDDEDEDE